MFTLQSAGEDWLLYLEEDFAKAQATSVALEEPYHLQAMSLLYDLYTQDQPS